MANGITFEEQYLIYLVPYIKTSPTYNNGGPYPDPVDPIPNADGWVQAVRNDIIKIAGSKVGGLLLRSIKLYGKMLMIYPKDENECNAHVGEEHRIINWNNVDTKLNNPNPDPHANFYSGGAEMQFTPNTYKVGGKCESYYHRIGSFHSDSNEVLLHELVHAFRHISGKINKTQLGKGLAFYDDNEEFNAVLVQGIYASERRTPIRASHFKRYVLDKQLDKSLTFFKSGTETFHYVEKFCKENPGFTKGIANIDVPFNPFKAYYEFKEQARKLSQSSLAKQRDLIGPIARVIAGFITPKP